MFIQVNSTRHTKAGTFRFGVVYEINEKDQTMWDVVEPLMEGENSPLKKLSKSAAEKIKGKVVSLIPDPVVGDDLVVDDTELATVTGERDTAQADLATVTGERDTAQADLATVTGERDVAQADLVTATGERDTALVDLATVTDERDALEAELAVLKGDK